MRQIFIFIVLFLSTDLNYAQSCGIDFDRSTGITHIHKKNKLKDGISTSLNSNLINKKNCLKRTDLSLTQKSMLANNIASMYSYHTNNIDSVKKYIKLSKDFDIEWFNYHIVLVEDLHDNDDVYSKDFYPYYIFTEEIKQILPKILKFDRTSYVSEIFIQKEKRKYEFQAPKNLDYSVTLKKIKELDQKYRKGNVLEAQHVIDNKNRSTLDSLFNIYGFPTVEKVGTNQSLTAWLVLQHSTDCEWNEKWLKRFLNAYQKEEIKAGLLKETFHRFYNKENGYCREQDAESAHEFIDSLKTTYPLEYQETFGYKDY